MRLWLIVAAVTIAGSSAMAQDLRPLKLSLQEDLESVYAPPAPPSPADGTNLGGVSLDLRFTYMTDYVFRGIDRSEVGGSEDAPNLQLEQSIAFDLGKLPHPFVGVFVNVFDSDPVSRFQEIRPFFGADLKIRPFILSAGHVTYIFPEREEQNTSEFYGKITLMDEAFLRREKPVLSPYVKASYDYDLFSSWYFEAGISHDFEFENTGLSFRFEAAAYYAMGYEPATGKGGDDTGFQRYQLGLTGSYSLNTLLNMPRRLGDWSIVGYIYYTDALSNDLKTDTQLWGGGGIEFSY